MLVGPIAVIERTKTYDAPGGAHELLVSFTPPATPARQDFLMRVGDRTLTVLVREPAEAKELARKQSGATLVATEPIVAGRTSVTAAPFQSMLTSETATGSCVSSNGCTTSPMTLPPPSGATTNPPGLSAGSTR